MILQTLLIIVVFALPFRVLAQDVTTANDGLPTSSEESPLATNEAAASVPIARSDFARRQQLTQIDEDLKAAQQESREWDAVADAVENYRDSLPKADQYATLYAQLGSTPGGASGVTATQPPQGGSVVQQLIRLVITMAREIDFTDDAMTPIARSRDVTTMIRRLHNQKEKVAPKAHSLPFGVTGATADALRAYSPQQFQAERDAIGTLCEEFVQEARANSERKRKEVSTLRSRRAAILYEIDKPRVEINELAIKLGLPLFCATVVILFCIPLLVRQFGRGEDTRAIFSSGILIEINTILLLTMSILILGLADKMKGEVLGTLLGGISGYVLNRIRERRGRSDEMPPEAPNDGSPDLRGTRPGSATVSSPSEPPTYTASVLGRTEPLSG